MSTSKPLLRALLTLAVVILALALLVWLLPVREWLVSAMTLTFHLGYWGFLFFYVLYVLLACLAMPTTPLNIAAGILFSLWSGYLVALAGAATSAVVVFLFARYVAHDWVRARLQRIEGSDRLLAGIADEGVKFVALTRANPLVPAAVKNFGFAVTDVPLYKYAAGTVLGQLPVVFVHVWLGRVGGFAMMRADARPEALKWLMVGAGIIATALLGALAYWLVRRRRRA